MRKTRNIILILVAIALAWIISAWATEYYVPVAGALGYEEVSCLAASANNLTLNTVKNVGRGMARIYVSAYPVAIRSDGTAPTSGTAQQVPVGAYIYLNSQEEMQNFKAIGIGGTAVLAVQYYFYNRGN